MKRTKKTIVASFLSLVVVVFGTLVFRVFSPETGYRFPRHIQYGFTLENTSRHAVRNAQLWAYVPIALTASQSCQEIRTSHPSQVVTDKTGNRILHFIFDLVPPYATKIVNIEATLLLSEKPKPCNLDDPGPFLKAETYCESDDPAIRRLARALETTNSLKTAENIFKWVNANVTYSGYGRNVRGAVYALKHRNGDCTEFMYLFAALCRANKIPVRCVSGFLCKEDGLLKPGAFHNWAEFYHGGSWWISDPQKGLFMKDSSGYIGMRMINGLKDPAIPRFDRFRIKGDGLQGRMNS